MTSRIPIPRWLMIAGMPVYLIYYVGCFLPLKGADKVREWAETERPFPHLRRNRRRALTLPLPEEASNSLGRRAQQTFDQKQSPFLARLPLEIRYMIYGYVLGPPDQVLHVVRKRRGISGIQCHYTSPVRPFRDHGCWNLVGRGPNYEPGPNDDWHARYLNLLRSCRQIYSEAVNTLYADRILSIEHPWVVPELPKVMLPHRLAMIRKMDVGFRMRRNTILGNQSEKFIQMWKSTCQGLSEIAAAGNLQRLVITLDHVEGKRPRPEASFWITDEILALCLCPLMNIRVPDFNVVLHLWPQSQDDVTRIIGEDVPFSVKIVPMIYSSSLEWE